MATNIPVVFKFGTRAEYDALATKTDGALYFLTDTGELLRGERNLAQANYYEGTLETVDGVLESHNAAISRVTTGAYLIKNDVCIIKEKLFDGAYSHTAYVYDGSAWRAMDGNYNAENVYFDQDLIFTKDVGYVTVDSTGSVTVETEGKNVKQVFEMLFSKETDPTATLPTLALTASQNKGYEVGTVVTPQYSLSFDPGSYTYGPATGITATYSVTDSENSTAQTTTSGVFGQITVGDDTEYYIYATANYTQGAIPVSNLGNAVESKRIAANSIEKTSPKLYGYRAFFYGASAADAVTSSVIRNLKNGGAAKAQTLGNYAASSVAGAKKVIIAIPASSSINLKKVTMPSAQNADITTEFVLQDSYVQVAGKNDYEAADYKVWIYQPASLDQSEVYSIVLG